ncbi:PIN domain-like protein [Lipomyces arxii]|uniref:PIN domain-like protein n=1 Tax=Lipomyces arxii TaxID=56418 RepID=UPI0034CE9096
MGVPGLWEFLDSHQLGEELCLAVLAERIYEEKSRRLRLAIDGNFWSFKNKGGKGGKFPEQRTFYYKLCRLMGLCVDAVFVFDGPQKPEFKRNARVSTILPTEVKWMMQIIQCFGFNSLIAPGEAEAECAWLQQQGLVDFVMTDDVDSLMFGATRVLKGWKPYANGSLASVTVQLYESDKICKEAGLTKSGMVLVAMMSGGDYCSAGVPHCGSKTAIEIAQAGYGKLLIECGFETTRLVLWKEKLRNSLLHNKSKEFRSCHQAIKISSEFPQRDLFDSYLQPVVSRTHNPIVWNRELDLAGMFAFASRYIGHNYQRYATYIAPALLSWSLFENPDNNSIAGNDIFGFRHHKSTAFLKEWRINIDPSTLVPSDLLTTPDNESNEDFQRDSSNETIKSKRHWIADYIVMSSHTGRRAIHEYQQLVINKSKKKNVKETDCANEQTTKLDRFLKVDQSSHGLTAKIISSSNLSPTKITTPQRTAKRMSKGNELQENKLLSTSKPPRLELHPQSKISDIVTISSSPLSSPLSPHSARQAFLGSKPPLFDISHEVIDLDISDSEM